MPESKLTPKQRRFVEEYLCDLNATQAAIRAGYSEKTAQQMGTENLSKPVIAAAIESAMQKRSERVEITQDRVLEELSHIAFARIDKVVKWDPDGVTLLGSSYLDEHTLAAVSEVSETTTQHGGSQRIKMHDKLGALTKLGEHLAMWKQRVAIGGDPDGVPLRAEEMTEEQIDRALARYFAGEKAASGG